MDDKKLNEFVKKLIELQTEKNQQEALPEQDLQYIAQNIGIEIEDLKRTRRDYLTRAQTHLKYRNWEDAREEFEQLITLDPHNDKAYFGLAQAYEALWEDNQKRKDYKSNAIEAAQKSIGLNPDNHAAYKIIGNLKRKRIPIEKAIKQRIKSSSGNRKNESFNWAFFVIVFLVSMSLYWTMSDVGETISNQITRIVPKNINLYASGASIDKDGAVFWSIEYEQYRKNQSLKRDFFVRIINPETGEEKQKIYFSKESEITKYHWRDIELINAAFYNYNRAQKTFEARNISDGEVILNSKMLGEKYPELKIGIGEVSSTNNWYKLTLKNGDVYWYSPYFELLEDEQTHKLQERYRRQQKVPNYYWNYEKQGQKKRFYLFRKDEPKRVRYQWKQNRGRAIDFARGFNYRYQGQQITTQKGTWFINGEVLYGDKDICLIWHNDEVGENAKNILSAIDASGKLLWQNQDSGSKFIASLKESSITSTKSTRYEENLVIHHPYLRYNDTSYHFAIGINLKNGKILWEYSPTLAEEN